MLNSSKTKDLLGAAKSAAAGGAAGLAPTAPLLPGGGSAAASTAAPRLPLTTFDEDFLQAGAVIEGARTYVLGILFLAAQAAQLVFLKVRAGCQAECWVRVWREDVWDVQTTNEQACSLLHAAGAYCRLAFPACCSSFPHCCPYSSAPHLLASLLSCLQSSLDALRAPALLLFLHLAPAALTLWLLGAQGVLELRPLRCALHCAACCAVLCCAVLGCSDAARVQVQVACALAYLLRAKQACWLLTGQGCN